MNRKLSAGWRVAIIAALFLSLLLPRGTILPPAYAAPKPPAPENPTPLPPTVTPQPIEEYAPPVPSTVLPMTVAEQQAQATMQAVLDKYLRYWGPRYQVAPVEVIVEGDWAHGVVEWRSQVRTLSGPIHILAHRLPDGTWQAVMPGQDTLYVQWIDDIPESLISFDEKNLLRTYALDADISRRTPSVCEVQSPTDETLLSEEMSSSLQRFLPRSGELRTLSTPFSSFERRSRLLENPPFLWAPNGTLLLYHQLNSSQSGPGSSPYDLWLFDAATNTTHPISVGSNVWRFAFANQGQMVQFWQGGRPFQASITNLDRIVPQAVTTARIVSKGEFSPDGSQLLYLTEQGQVRILRIQDAEDRVLGTLRELGHSKGLWPEWSPDGKWIAFLATGSVQLLPASASSLDELRVLGRVVEPEGELSPSAHYLRWSADSAFLFSYLGDVFAVEERAPVQADLSEESSTNSRVIAYVQDGEIFVHDRVSGSIRQLTTNQRTILESQVSIEPETRVTTAAVADGFDFPVGKPNGDGYNHTAGWDFLDWTGDVYHPGEDWNKDCSYDCDLGDPVYAVANGVVIDSNYYSPAWGNIILIEHVLPDGSKVWSQYAHLKDRLAATGKEVSKGEQIGTIGKGAGDIYWAHLHFEIRVQYRSASAWVTGWSQSQVLQYYTDPSDFINSHRQIGGTCTAPSLNSPADGYIHTSSDRTIAFNWSAPSNCTPDGYTFRVSTSPNMDIVPGLPDRGEGGTSTSHTFDSQWDNTDLYWSVRACKPCTPYTPSGWAPARRFRIEPSSPQGNWNARYDQGSTCWWDPNCSMNPRCTETVPGPQLHKDWGSSAPCGGMSGDDWVGDFQATINFPSADYVFQLEHDDGVKLWLNGQNIQERSGSGSGPVCPARHLSGDNQLRVLLREEGGDAKVHLTWTTDTSVCTPTPNPPTLQSPANGSLFEEGQSISLAWSATGNEYYGEVWGGPAGTTTFGWQSGTTKNIGSQWAGYTYSWHVMARNTTGESGWSSTWTFTVRPAAPSNLSAQTASCSQVNLYWNDNSGNEEGYKIYRNGSYIGQVGMNTTSYQSTGLSENTTYSYYVKAFRGSIESAASNTVQVTTPSCAPPQPDLMPSQWGGWQYPVVPSSVPGTNVANTLYAGQPTYIDWGLSNAGNASTGGNTYGDLYIDDVRVGHYDFGDVLAGQTWAFFDWVETISTPGWHTLKSIADPDNYIAESNETNNVFQHDFYWTPSAPYADTMESGSNDWTATGLWHQVDAASNFYGESHSWSHSWWYGQDDTGDYDTGGANAGDLTSPPVYVPSAGYYLRFWYRYETETMANDWDVRSVQIAVDGGQFNEVLQLWDDPMNFWLQSPALDLSGYAGRVIQVRFHFDTRDAYFNDYRGWYIDDLDISTTPPPSCADHYEPNNTAAQARAIAYGQTLSADICPGGDYDFYTFAGSAGDKVVVDIDAKVNGSLLDSYIFLLDSDGTTVLAQHDDEIDYEVQDSLLGYHLPHDGTYYIKVRAWDHPSAGSTDHFYDIRLLTDEGLPSSAQVTSPANDAWLDPTLQTVTVSATDDESGVNRVEFLWHDADWENSDWVWLGADRDGRDGWTSDLDTSGLPEQRGGAFYVWAFDWVGNWTGAGAWNLGIDWTPPTVTAAIYPTYGDAPFVDFWVTWWGGSDNLSGIASYDVQVRDDLARAWTDLAIDTTEVYTHFVGLDGHTYYFRARARDDAGNEGSYTDGDGDTQHTVQVCPVAADDYEADNDASTARSIPLDGTWQAHNVHAEGDQDWAQFYAATGVTYTLATTTTGEHADTVLFLYEPDGTTLIASDDDGGEDYASRLEWQPATSGTYYAMVEHWDPWAYGCTTGYELSISTDDEAAPTGSVRINADATYASSTAVTLNLEAADVGTGVGQAMAANSSDFAGAAWVDYAASLAWTLTPGDGTKTVYVKLRDRAGNQSGVYSDTIILDTTPPTGSILIEGGAGVVTGTQVILTLSADDANGVAQMRLRNDAEAWGAWEAFGGNRSWTLPDLEGEHTVWAQFRDPAGNVSTGYADTVVLDSPVHYVHLPIVLRNR